MSSSKKGKKRAESSDSESDSGPDDRTPAKKSKVTTKKAAKGDESDSTMIQLSRMRYVNVREFHGKVLVDIREFYDKDGDLKPGKKGICLSLDQWNALKENIDNVDEAIKQF